ncbi:uncharacterized protein [Physcomitrium patens]|nr:uncharacterized protein LOC112288697 isoform X3 [Physcomitrium patens]|eukprot:XP_024388938.1 uncharacterized protein LOC112288697 isoform X3 [Physcomitrella patens]
MISLEKKVDSILVQHIEYAWKELNLESIDVHAQRQMKINQDGLTADILQIVFEDTVQQSEGCIKDETADVISKMSRANYQDMDATEISTKCFSSPLQSESSPLRGELFPTISGQKPCFPTIVVPVRIEVPDGQSKISGTSHTTTLKDTASAIPEAYENSLPASIAENFFCVSSQKPLFISIQAQSAPNEGQYSTLPLDEGPNHSIFPPEVPGDVGRRESNDPSQCSSPADRESTATFDANRCMKEIGNLMDDAAEDVTQSHELISTVDEYYSASSDGEHDASTKAVETKYSVDADLRLAMVANGSSASLTGENGSETTEVQRLPPNAGPGCPGRMQAFSNNTDINGGVQKFDEHDMCHSPVCGNAGVKYEFESKSVEECSRDEELVEVEMTMRAKICEPEGEEPYWHVIFALLNHSNFKISVQKLEYWSLDQQEDVKCIHWPPGEMILREQPSFLCYSIKLPCCALSTSPRLAFSWQYRKLPEWIPTKGGKPKLENHFSGKAASSETRRALTCTYRFNVYAESNNPKAFRRHAGVWGCSEEAQARKRTREFEVSQEADSVRLEAAPMTKVAIIAISRTFGLGGKQ